MTTDLPPGWTQVSISDVCRPVGKTDPRNSPDVSFDYIDIGGVQPQSGRIQETKTLMGVDAPSRARQIVRAGDVVLSTVRTYQRKTAIIPDGLDGAIASTGFAVLRPHAGIDSRFILFQALSQEFVEQLNAKQTGTSYPAVRVKDVRSASIRIAPSAEQKRIVAAIEEHFSRLDAADSALSAAEQRLDALLQSTLRTLCDGSWTVEPLVHIIKSLKNGVFVSRPSATPPGHPIYRISAVRPLTLRVDDVRYVDPIPDGASGYVVETGDILFTRYSGNPDYVGAAAVVHHEGAGVLHPDKLIRVVANRHVALPEWIAAYVTAGTGRREVEKRLKTTAGQVGISGSQLGSVPIAVPPISYQQQAADRIGHVLAEQTQISRSLSSAGTRVGALRRSILSEAFAGRLVPQDPTDEPASVLLEHIATSRKSTPKRQEVEV